MNELESARAQEVLDVYLDGMRWPEWLAGWGAIAAWSDERVRMALRGAIDRLGNDVAGASVLEQMLAEMGETPP